MMKTLKKIMWIYIRFVQKILITILLTLTYFLVIPFSWLYMLIFKSALVTQNFTISQTYWSKTSKLSNTIEEFTEQS
jgi:hypothetical protein